MPCYTVQTMSVEFRAAHADLLDAAIQRLGWTMEKQRGDRVIRIPGAPAMRWDNIAERMEIQVGQQDRLNELKRAYSAECLRRVAQLNRWTVSRATATKGSLLKQY